MKKLLSVKQESISFDIDVRIGARSVEAFVDVRYEGKKISLNINVNDRRVFPQTNVAVNLKHRPPQNACKSDHISRMSKMDLQHLAAAMEKWDFWF